MTGVTTAVLGSGGWGTTFAAVLADAAPQAEIRLWGRSTETCREINQQRSNTKYLPELRLPTNIRATTDLAEAVGEAELVAVALPSQQARKILAPLRNQLAEGTVVVSLMKGIEVETGELMSTMLADTLGVPDHRVAVVSGPNLAGEIAAQQPTATVVAATTSATAHAVAEACATPYFRPYTNHDVVGVELGGAATTVIALAVGIARGAGFGDNTTASIITRGLAETTRLGTAMGARAETFAGLAGMGDLVATCASPLSRNNALGYRIGQGMSLAEATRATGGTAEGVATCRSVVALARRYGIEMPISEAVTGVLHHGVPVSDMPHTLLSRPRKSEGD